MPSQPGESPQHRGSNMERAEQPEEQLEDEETGKQIESSVTSWL